MDMDPSREARLHLWLDIAAHQPPEWLAAYVQSPTAPWQVVIEDGPDNDRHVYTARLDTAEDLPCWAFVLAKAFLEDVEEWPLFGGRAEIALDHYEDHLDPARAVREILASVLPVWPEVTVVQVGPVQAEIMQ